MILNCVQTDIHTSCFGAQIFFLKNKGERWKGSKSSKINRKISAKFGMIKRSEYASHTCKEFRSVLCIDH